MNTIWYECIIKRKCQVVMKIHTPLIFLYLWSISFALVLRILFPQKWKVFLIKSISHGNQCLFEMIKLCKKDLNSLVSNPFRRMNLISSTLFYAFFFLLVWLPGLFRNCQGFRTQHNTTQHKWTINIWPKSSLDFHCGLERCFRWPEEVEDDTYLLANCDDMKPPFCL